MMHSNLRQSESSAAHGLTLGVTAGKDLIRNNLQIVTNEFTVGCAMIRGYSVDINSTVGESVLWTFTCGLSMLRRYCQTLVNSQTKYSGVGTVAAVAALAATLFRPYINIHNLLRKLAQASLVLWERGQAASVASVPYAVTCMKIHIR